MLYKRPYYCISEFWQDCLVEDCYKCYLNKDNAKNIGYQDDCEKSVYAYLKKPYFCKAAYRCPKSKRHCFDCRQNSELNLFERRRDL